jgi:hypothetical protein
MTNSYKPAVVSGVYSFSDVVNQACEKLMDRQIKYSIRRIQEMDEYLSAMEKELDEFLAAKDRN